MAISIVNFLTQLLILLRFTLLLLHYILSLQPVSLPVQYLPTGCQVHIVHILLLLTLFWNSLTTGLFSQPFQVLFPLTFQHLPVLFLLFLNCIVVR